MHQNSIKCVANALWNPFKNIHKHLISVISWQLSYLQLGGFWNLLVSWYFRLGLTEWGSWFRLGLSTTVSCIHVDKCILKRGLCFEESRGLRVRSLFYHQWTVSVEVFESDLVAHCDVATRCHSLTDRRVLYFLSCSWLPHRSSAAICLPMSLLTC